MTDVEKALTYLLQKPKTTRQTNNQNLNDFIKNGVPTCYDPCKYRKAIEILSKIKPLPLTNDHTTSITID